jgi:hypothetical protein
MSAMMASSSASPDNSNGSSDDRISAKRTQLQVVYTKALEESVNSIGEADLTECCKDVKKEMGGSLQRTWAGDVANAEERMQKGFQRLGRHQDVDRLLSGQQAATTRDGKTAAPEYEQLFEAQQAQLAQLRQKESEKLKQAIAGTEEELSQVREAARWLRAGTESEMASMLKACRKLEEAAQQCTKQSGYYCT